MKYIEDFLRFREETYFSKSIEERLATLEDLMYKVLDNLYGKEMRDLSDQNWKKLEASMKEFNKGRKRLTQEEILARLK